MTNSQFSFLEAEFGDLFEMASWAERHALSDPGPAVIYARKCLESGVRWVFRHDRGLPRPYDGKLNAYLSEPAFKALEGGRVFSVARKIQLAGNRAVHESKPPSKLEAVEIVSALFRFCFWLAFTYGRSCKPESSLRFDPHKLMDARGAVQASLGERRELLRRLERESAEHARARVRLEESTRTAEELSAELAGLRAEVAAAKRAAEAMPAGVCDWSEADTRRYKIDALLAEAGWVDLVEGRDTEYRVRGMPSESGVGYADYVLWGDDGLPLAVVEAKQTLTDARAGQQQAKLYADCLEAETGQRPVVFYSDGYEHWLWDDVRCPARRVQGFYTADELALLIQRRASRRELSALRADERIAGRHYQLRAVRAAAEHFEADGQRKALLVMATGAGKTRTVIALADLLMRAGWVKRVLFLADRTALVRQAVNAFKAWLPDSDPVNLAADGRRDGRVCVSTYQTMVGKIDEYRPDGSRRFGVGHFDLVVIDEAHRSVYRKYRGIFDYFDSLLVGLTATPKDEVARNTYDLFDLEVGVPTDAYPLDEAIGDGYLVAPRGVSVPLKFVREGIRYADLPEDEKDAWDELDWGDGEDGEPVDPPVEVGAAQINKWLFNRDTVDRVLEHLMVEGVRVAGGDRLGKTIVFAKNQRHADFVKERFDANYPQLDAGGFARVVTHQVRYAESLIDDFSDPGKPPHIAISVDMLDTGIDVPEVVNLVFFKLVGSKTKFWQMLGRGTRLREDLFGPGRHKTGFNVFDFCQNLEYFSQPLDPPEPSPGRPLSELLFSARLELLHALDSDKTLSRARRDIAAVLHEAVASMNPDNFLVRPHLALVERFSALEAWQKATLEDLAALNERVAGLPDQLDPEHEDAKRFDVLILNAQLGLLRGEPFERQRQHVIDTASALEDLGTAIPAVAEQLELVQSIQTDEWWTDVNYPILEDARKRLRGIVQLIERTRKTPLYSDFTDALGESTIIQLPGTSSSEFSSGGSGGNPSGGPDCGDGGDGTDSGTRDGFGSHPSGTGNSGSGFDSKSSTKGSGRSSPGSRGSGCPGVDFAQFQKKARHFLSQNLADGIVAKIRSGEPITAADTRELQRVLVAAGVGDTDTFARASQRAGSFGLFIRSLVGLDRAAAKRAFARFLNDKRYTRNQITFVNLVIDYLTQHGAIEHSRVYESPFTGAAPEGPDAIFTATDLDDLFGIIDRIRSTAAAA